MNEITRIHIAKTAYDIEIAAKKQLEKYIKSLETYTQDEEVLKDIEIRITELLEERGVVSGGVITTLDVDAVRKQLGEPYEFADDEGDIALGATAEVSNRRMYRSTDDAVLGGVLSGVAAYFNVNPLWTRLVFILSLFASFGLMILVYIVFWIIIPPARTATEKLQLVGKDVTLESIKDLNTLEDTAQPNKVAPVLQRVTFMGLGVLSLIAAAGVVAGIVSLIIAALTAGPEFADITNGFTGLGDGNTWIVWLVFWIVMLGLALLSMLLGIIAYAFLARKVTKKLFISGVVIAVLGLTSAAAAVGISATQSWRVATETRSMVHETKASLPAEFANVTSAKFTVVSKKTDSKRPDFFGNNTLIQYIVDNGPMRYELSALPNAKPSITVDGTTATISLTVPESYRNSFVRPILTVYGPALTSITASSARDVEYTGQSQAALTIATEKESGVSVIGTYTKVVISGDGGWVDTASSTIQVLDIQSKQGMSVTAGTVRELTVVQPDVCPAGTNGRSTTVTVDGVTSGQMSYNGSMRSATSYQTSCAAVIIEPFEQDLL